jgi:hypothetical protein
VDGGGGCTVFALQAFITGDVDAGRGLVLSRRAVVAGRVVARRGLVLSSFAVVAGLDTLRLLVLAGGTGRAVGVCSAGTESDCKDILIHRDVSNE